VWAVRTTYKEINPGRFDCDNAGLVTSISDPLSHTIAFSYAHGDLASVTDPLGRTSTRFNDGGGRLLESTNPLNETTSYSYDKVNRLIQITDPIGGQIGFVFDDDGNLTQVNDDRRGSTSQTAFAYNDMNLPAPAPILSGMRSRSPTTTRATSPRGPTGRTRSPSSATIRSTV
jgi:YD repeat-containing protein